MDFRPLIFRVLRRLALNTLATAIFVLVVGLLIYGLEKWTGGRTGQYQRRGFWHDLTYFFFVRSGLSRLFFFSAFAATIGSRLSVFHVQLLSSLPAVVRWIAFWLVTEFLVYWLHRWQHSNRFLWCFHSTHHSARSLAFVTAERVHPIETFLTDLLTYIPMLVIGVSVNDWLPMVFLTEVVIVLQHSEVRTRFGPLYRIVVSPTFHSFHHSLRPEHHDRNFGRILSIWDFAFGTAVDEPERAQEYGLADVEMPTLLSTLLVPFRTIYQTYFRKDRTVALAERVDT